MGWYPVISLGPREEPPCQSLSNTLSSRKPRIDSSGVSALWPTVGGNPQTCPKAGGIFALNGGVLQRILIKIPQSVANRGFQTFGAPEGTRTPASGSGGLRDIHFTTGALTELL